jgi:hypothetical protein
MVSSLYRMIRFGPALAVLPLMLGWPLMLGCGGVAFTAGDPSDAEADVTDGDPPETSADVVDAAADVLEPDDSSWSCNPAHGFFTCGSGDTINIGQVCAEQTDGGLLGYAHIPAACGCTPTCACVLSLIDPCMGHAVPEYPASCSVTGGNMTVTCTTN